MAVNTGGSEIVDLSGSTTHYNGSAALVAANLPSVSNKVISEVFISCPLDQAPTARLQVSFDGGGAFVTIPAGGHIVWSPKGYRRQIQIKANFSGVLYQTIFNFETF